MLILFAIYVDRVGKTTTTPATNTQQAQQAMAVFSFFLFLIYGFFGLLLSVFRNDVIVEGMLILHRLVFDIKYYLNLDSFFFSCCRYFC